MTQATHEAPEGETEERLAEIFRNVLQLPDVGRHDDFFDLGGNSQTLLSLTLFIEEELGVDLDLATVFDHANIAELAQMLKSGEGAADSPHAPPGVATAPALGPRSSGGWAPLSFTQQSMWRDAKLDRRPSAREVASALRLGGRLNVGSLRESLAEMVRRHEALRTTLVIADGVPMQRIAAPGAYALQVIDLTTLAEDERTAEAVRIVEQFVRQPVAMSEGPLFDARLLKLGAREHVLAIAVHHIVSDGMSLGILFRELWTLYAQSVRGLPFSLPPPQIQFPDYAAWQQAASATLSDESRSYWSEYLRGARLVRLTPEAKPGGDARVDFPDAPFNLGEDITAALREFGKAERTTLVICALTAYIALLLRWTQETDIVLQFVTTGRHHREVENTIGPFASVLYLRAQLRESDTLMDLMRRVNRDYYTACDRDDLGSMNVELLSDELALCPGFNWHTRRPRMAEPDDSEHAIERRPFAFERDNSEEAGKDGEPILALSESDHDIAGRLSYRADRFGAAEVSRFIESYRFFAQTLARNPGMRLVDLTCQQGGSANHDRAGS